MRLGECSDFAFQLLPTIEVDLSVKTFWSFKWSNFEPRALIAHAQPRNFFITSRNLSYNKQLDDQLQNNISLDVIQENFKIQIFNPKVWSKIQLQNPETIPEASTNAAIPSQMVFLTLLGSDILSGFSGFP